MNKKQKSLIVSMVLGDGYIDKNNYLSIQHSCKQEEYLEHKKGLLKENNLKVSRTYDVSRQYCAKRFNCVEPSILKHYRHQFYPNRNRTVTRHLLNQLDEEGLAIWFMDDGSCCKRYKNGYGNGRHLQIATNAFTKEENDIICNYLNIVWGIKVRVKEAKRKNKPISYYIRIIGDDARKFIEIIRPYVIESMKYKINFEYEVRRSKELPNVGDGIA